MEPNLGLLPLPLLPRPLLPRPLLLLEAVVRSDNVVALLILVLMVVANVVQMDAVDLITPVVVIGVLVPQLMIIHLVGKVPVPLLPLLLVLPNPATAPLGITGVLGKILSVTFLERGLWLMAQVGSLSTRRVLME